MTSCLANRNFKRQKFTKLAKIKTEQKGSGSEKNQNDLAVTDSTLFKEFADLVFMDGRSQSDIRFRSKLPVQKDSTKTSDK